MMRRIGMILCAAVLCAGVVLLGGYIKRLRSAANVNEELTRIYNEDASAAETARQKDNAAEAAPSETQRKVPADKDYQYIGSEVLAECRTLQKINSDLVGWLNVPGELDLPVVYRDNSYYLNHDFYKRDNDSGTVFLDEAHPFEADTQYLFLHGHNVWDGSMLGNLTHYRNTEYIKENPYLYFNTLYRRETYEIIGVMRVTQQEMYGLMRLGTPTFENGAEFNSFIESLRSRALRFTDKEIAPDDALLAISTCWENDRIVVLFRRTDRSEG